MQQYIILSNNTETKLSSRGCFKNCILALGYLFISVTPQNFKRMCMLKTIHHISNELKSLVYLNRCKRIN